MKLPFHDKPQSHYRDRITGGELVSDVVNEFIYAGIDALMDIEYQFAGLNYVEREKKADKQFCACIKELHRFAKSISIVSHGYESGYILCEQWFQIIFSQFAMAGARFKGDEERIERDLRRRWGMLGWDFDFCMNPPVDEYGLMVTVKHIVDSGETVEYPMLFTIPRGSDGEYLDTLFEGDMYEGMKGAVYRFVKRLSNGAVQMETVSETGKKKIRVLNKDQFFRLKRMF